MTGRLPIRRPGPVAMSDADLEVCSGRRSLAQVAGHEQLVLFSLSGSDGLRSARSRRPSLCRDTAMETNLIRKAMWAPVRALVDHEQSLFDAVTGPMRFDRLGSIQRKDAGPALGQIEHDVAMVLINRLSLVGESPSVNTIPFTYSGLARDLGWRSTGGTALARLHAALDALVVARFSGDFYSPVEGRTVPYRGFGIVESVRDPDVFDGKRFPGTIRLSHEIVTNVCRRENPNVTYFCHDEYRRLDAAIARRLYLLVEAEAYPSSLVVDDRLFATLGVTATRPDHRRRAVAVACRQICDATEGRCRPRLVRDRPRDYRIVW